MKLPLALLVAGIAFGQQKVIQHMMLIEPSGTDLTVNETIIFQAEKAGEGAFEFFLPPDAGGEVRVQSGGKPLTARKTAKANVYRVKFPLTAGESRVDLAWTMPFILPETLEGRVLHGGALRIVVPQGVTVVSKEARPLGAEPTTKASIFEIPGGAYKLAIDGAGTLKRNDATPAAPAAEQAVPVEDNSPQIEQIMPRVWSRMPWIAGIAVAILAIGFYLNFRATTRS